ncbi:winged helix-turn-helix domain-containing protein [Pleionea sp. CnH1-48]|uniref:winged helix-turn-helix domain-containing protein n=1 Tax=Pleionea sp. CnH1-48 TaxID=2954494 RepID=UPI00209738D1|nr:winged helix-turn-helix domain-containing protein [Pleionea sp. CnH1-48]MCO7223372.1 winged helix-turn-helix domain-containing protein [Pleionea sp. CnH1-48]
MRPQATMLYRFKDFEFNSADLVLKQKGEAVAIRHNEAKVLSLLLQHRDKVLSKNDILSHVWQDKVVSDQAIFQNISHLRNLLGNDAIKTFSKRGYQWQLPLVQSAEPKHSPQPTTDITLKASKPRRSSILALAAIVLVFCLGFILTTLRDTSDQNTRATVSKIAYLPFSDPQDGSSIELTDNEHFNFTALTHIDSRSFNLAIELEYPKIADEHPMVLSIDMRAHNQITFLDFSLKGRVNEWNGELSASNTTQAIAKLQQHLQQDFLYSFLNEVQPPQVKLANLAIAHQQRPSDLILLGHLVHHYIASDELDKAMIMAEKLSQQAQEQKDSQQQGNALLYQSQILTSKELYELSAQKLTAAIEQFEHIGNLKRQADAWVARSWLDHQAGDYAAVKNDLLMSAQLSEQARDVSRELHALTYLSVMASKNRQDEDKYQYLRQAESKMRSYQLPIYHFAKIPFHYSIFTKKPSDKEPHLKRVLEYTQLTPNHWVAKSSREQLLTMYIEQNRLSDAKALVDTLVANNAHNAYLRVLLAKATQDSHAFIVQAQRAFEQAEMAGETPLSLNIALLLCEEKDTHVNYDFYSQYIREHATQRWSRINQEKLTALNL